MGKRMKKVLWIAHQLFERGLVTGSTGNISFREDGYVYISKSGSCFGLLDENSFAKLTLAGEIVEGRPSKEYPMHLTMYRVSEETQIVIHTHSFYTTLVSCLKAGKTAIDGLFSYTPYLRMKTGGNIKLISYHEPGSRELFDEFEAVAEKQTGVYLLSNHGAVVASKDMMEAFYTMEELEVSAKTLCHIWQCHRNSYWEIEN